MTEPSEAIIKRIEHSYTEMVNFYHNVPLDHLVAPALPNGWSVKDTLAQIAAWEWRCAALLHQAHHTDGPLQARPDMDGLKQEIYQERCHWSWARVEADFRRAHRALLRAVRALPPDRLEAQVVQQAIARDTWEYYGQHLLRLKRWRRRVINRTQWAV